MTVSESALKTWNEVLNALNKPQDYAALTFADGEAYWMPRDPFGWTREYKNYFTEMDANKDGGIDK